MNIRIYQYRLYQEMLQSVLVNKLYTVSDFLARSVLYSELIIQYAHEPLLQIQRCLDDDKLRVLSPRSVTRIVA